jgi:molybdate transport system substrate-binding protein
MACLAAEFVYAAQPQRDFGIAQRDLWRGTVGASGQKGGGAVHANSLHVHFLFSRDSSHPACQPLPRIGAIGQVRQRFALKHKDLHVVIPILRATLVAIWLALPAKAADLTVFAAASLGDAMAELAAKWEADTAQDVTLVLAGSSTLARQIDAGAPADVYVSANETWMDWLSERGRIIAESRVDVASNRLVLVAHDPTSASHMDISPSTDIMGALGVSGRLAIALPEAVPAGIYAKTALSDLGLWEGLQARLAPTDNVRAALALVALGEAPLGVVYATDAMAEPRVVTAGLFPEDSHPPIRYPAAVTSDTPSPEDASAFVTWLASPAAQEVLGRFGFLPVRTAQ